MSSNGWGQLTWNLGAWGNQSDADVQVTGLSATSSIGTLLLLESLKKVGVVTHGVKTDGVN